jgi:hypothetical protein
VFEHRRRNGFRSFFRDEMPTIRKYTKGGTGNPRGGSLAYGD